MTFEAFVEDELLAGLRVFGLDGGMQVDLHLAALREDGDGAVLVGGQIDAVGRGRGAELVDLFLERVICSRARRARSPSFSFWLIRLDELTVRLAQLVLEDHEVLGVSSSFFRRWTVSASSDRMYAWRSCTWISYSVRRRRVLESDIEAGRNFEKPRDWGYFLVELLHSHPFSLDPCAPPMPSIHRVLEV